MFEPQDLGRAIKKIRGARTQKEVAAVAKISASSWSLYESGDRAPRKGMLLRIAKGLGASLKELEDEAWRQRNSRLHSEARPAPVSGIDRDTRARTVEEHTKAIADHLTKLFQLVLEPQQDQSS
jgi:transcriptional regulator with XRE-family HTH domain